MAKGGKRKGAGRKKGSRDKKTLEKELVLKDLKQRTMKVTDILFNSQLTLARGQMFLYKIEKEYIKTGKGGFYKKKKPKLVTTQAEIERYLEGTVAEGDPDDDQDPASTYYYITTKEPNSMSIDSMLDRTYGKATQGVAMVDPEGKAVPITQINVVPIQGPEIK